MAMIFSVGQLPRMDDADLDAFTRGLKLIMKAEGWKMKPLSEAAGMGESGVRDLFRFNSAPRVSNAYALSQQLGRTIDEIIEIGLSGHVADKQAVPIIAVAGRVGAGASVDLVDAYAKGGGLYHVACPPQVAPKGVVAVEVEGDSMAPVYEPGTVLFYSRNGMAVPTEAIGRICVCEDDNGHAWVKQVKIGREDGTYSLLSINPEAAHMHGVRLKWAAPVRFNLPPEFVVKLE